MGKVYAGYHGFVKVKPTPKVNAIRVSMEYDGDAAPAPDGIYLTLQPVFLGGDGCIKLFGVTETAYRSKAILYRSLSRLNRKLLAECGIALKASVEAREGAQWLDILEFAVKGGLEILPPEA